MDEEDFFDALDKAQEAVTAALDAGSVMAQEAADSISRFYEEKMRESQGESGSGVVECRDVRLQSNPVAECAEGVYRGDRSGNNDVLGEDEGKEESDETDGEVSEAEKKLDALIEKFNDALDKTLDDATEAVNTLLNTDNEDDGEDNEGKEEDDGKDKEGDGDNEDEEDVFGCVYKAVDVFSDAVDNSLSLLDKFMDEAANLAQTAMQEDFPERADETKEVADKSKELFGVLSKTMHGAVHGGLDALQSAVKDYEKSTQE